MEVLGIDIHFIRGVLLVLLIIAFTSIWIWAWSKSRKADFQEMSALPLEEDQGFVPGTGGIEKGSKE